MIATSSHPLLPAAPKPFQRSAVKEVGEADIGLAELVNRRMRLCLMESSGWHREAANAQRYYRSDQHRRDTRRQDRDRIRLVANFIRRDVDLMKSEVLDGKPIITTAGRRPKDYEIGRLLVEVLQWTRDEEENWDTDIERVITDCFHVGEGVLFEGWDQEADNGRGMPKSLYLDSRYVLWPKCNDIQKDDADFILWLEHEYLENILRIYPQLRGKVQPELLEHFMVPTYSPAYRRDRSVGAPYSPVSAQTLLPESEKKVWIKRMWSRKKVVEKRYFYQDDGEPAMVFDGEGKEVPLSDELFALLPPEEQEMVVPSRRFREELWETVVINKEVVEHHLSPFDKSKGGHGKYPFAFFSGVLLADEGRARGEIGFLINVQDIINETVTMLLDQLFLANTGYLNTIRGSMDPSDRAKLEDLSRKPFTVVETYPGYQPPTWQGMNPGGSTLFTRALDTMSGIMDKISGIHEPSRGDVPGYVESGRAIRALQSRSSLLTTTTRRHVEAGLRRATLLRLYNIAQFMRGNRLAKVVDEESREDKPIYVGNNELEIVLSNELMPAQDEKGKAIWQTPDGRKAEILILNDQTVQDILFEQVRLKLDTGVELNKIERMEQAQMVLNAVGKPAVPWAAAQMDWNNREQLIADVKRSDEAEMLRQQVDGLQKESGLPMEEILGMLAEAVKQRMLAEELAKKGGLGAGAIMPPGGGPPIGPLPPAGPLAPPAPPAAPEGMMAPPGPPVVTR